MLEKITVVDNHQMLLVSQRAVFAVIGFLLIMTLSLMSFFLLADFDYILGRKHLAMKVGQTSISLEELKKIQKISGARAQRATEAIFATEFFETLLLAEGGRKLGLDRDEEFVKKIADFDSALKNAGDDETVGRAVFLIEELAAATRNRISTLKSSVDASVVEKTTRTAPRTRLHLRTILLPDPEQVAMVLSEQASGTAFTQLSASYSISLYKGVGGDIGWKSAQDFPEGVFARLLTQPLNSLVEGFSDEAGTHLFAVISRQDENPEIAAKAAQEQLTRELKKRRLAHYMIELHREIDYWINPALQVKCQVVTGPARTDSPENL